VSLNLKLVTFSPSRVLEKIQWLLGVNTLFAKIVMQVNEWFYLLLQGFSLVLLLITMLIPLIKSELKNEHPQHILFYQYL